MTANKSKPIFVGTSGWHYKHWSGPFYPSELKKKDYLKYYADRLDTVEINNSFYKLPEVETLETWRDTVSAEFLFTLKASRYITHMKKLKDPTDSLSILFERVKALGKKLGPLLFQLPPRWRLNRERFDTFLAELPEHHRYAFEFRDPSWFHDHVYAQLKKHNAAFCIYELAGKTSPKAVTADFVYIRLHGPGEAYQGQYDNRVLAGWAGAFSSWAAEGKQVYCYFDNDEAGYAVQDALRLREMLA